MINQAANKNSKAIQAGRDVNIGMSYSDVKAIVCDLFENNFPKLVEEAQNKAKNNVYSYMEILESNLKAQIDSIEMDKFKNPNTQYLLNSSIKIAARKGQSINLDILSEILLTSLKKNSTKMLNIVAEQAIEVLPKLTAQQINIISLIHYIIAMNITGITDYAQSEMTNRQVMKITNDTNNIDSSDIQYISSLGIATFNQFRAIDPYAFIGQKYSSLFNGEKNISKIIEKKSPSMKIMADKYNELNLSVLTLTPVGMLIGLINLKRVFSGIDYTIWIK